MHGGYYFSLPEEVQRGEPSETRETQFRSCNCPGTRRKHQVFVPLLLGPRIAAIDLRVILGIVTSWVVTLPIGAGLAAFFFFFFKGVFAG